MFEIHALQLLLCEITVHFFSFCLNRLNLWKDLPFMHGDESVRERSAKEERSWLNWRNHGLRHGSLYIGVPPKSTGFIVAFLSSLQSRQINSFNYPSQSRIWRAEGKQIKIEVLPTVLHELPQCSSFEAFHICRFALLRPLLDFIIIKSRVLLLHFTCSGYRLLAMEKTFQRMGLIILISIHHSPCTIL
jgi:hypothetical protein